MNKLLTWILFFTGILYAQNYFPLSLGNSWTYTGSNDTVYKRTQSISTTTQTADYTYYLFGNSNSPFDTIRQDNAGNIVKLYRGTDHMWFYFTKDSGSVYSFPFSNYTYEVKVRKGLTVKTHCGTFTNCISFYFNAPGVIDDEIGYIFAPDIGLIVVYGAWRDDLLFSHNINGGPTSVSPNQIPIAKNISLLQNYPNPFNPNTMIHYQVHEPGAIKLTMHNLLGQEIETLVNETKNEGNYSVTFNGNNLPSGVYYYSLRSNNTVLTKKCLLMK